MKKFFWLLLIPLAFFLVAVLTVSDYNVNWDEPVHFMRGQAYWRYFLSGQKNYDNLPFFKEFQIYLRNRKATPKIPLPRYSLYQSDVLDGHYFFSQDAGHPPLNGILAAASNWLFYQKLGLLGDIESYHLLSLFLSSVLVLVVSLFAYQAYGVLAAVVSALSLSLYPLFWAESHFNIKDPIEACFYALTIYAFYLGVKNKSWRWFLASSVFCGFALGTKFNILFVPLIILPWLVARYWRERLKFKQRIFLELLKIPHKMLLSLVFYPLVVFLIFFASWPYLWADPFPRLAGIFGFYKQMGASRVDSQPPSFYLHGFNTYPIQTVIFTTPLIILFFTLMGIIASLFLFKKEREKISFFWLLWFWVPVLRVTMPGTSIYGGVRQIMEYIPAMALLAGLGAQQIVKLLSCTSSALRLKHLRGVRLLSRILNLEFRIEPYWRFLTTKEEKRRPRRPPRMVEGLLLTSPRRSVRRHVGPTSEVENGKSAKLVLIIFFLSFLPLTLKLIQLHPNEGLYFNPLIEGLKGAAERDFPGWESSLGNPYLQGVEWLNQNAEPNSTLVLSWGVMTNVPVIKLRRDINYANNLASTILREGEYIMGLTGHEQFLLYDGQYPERYLVPVYEKKVEEVPVLKIWKNDPAHTKKGFMEEKDISSEVEVSMEEDGLLIDFHQAYLLTRVELELTPKGLDEVRSGLISTSVDGGHWQIEREGLLELQIPKVPKVENGKVTHLLAVVPARFLKIKVSPFDQSYLSSRKGNLKIVVLRDLQPNQ